MTRPGTEKSPASMTACSPVVLFVYNRPSLSMAVVDRISAASPQVVYVVADGGRDEADWERCEETRRAVLGGMNWGCEVHTIFSEENMGSGRRICSGLDEVFRMEDRAVILEDDCLPDPTFFRFCSELLCRYENDTRVMHIAGLLPKGVPVPKNDSYFFSKHPLCSGGWATWRRAWEKNDFSMRDLEEAISRWQTLRVPHSSTKEIEYWAGLMRRTKEGEIDAWDYQWFYSIWRAEGMGVVPCRNLIRNVGEWSSRERRVCSLGSLDRDTEALTLPLVHPVKKEIVPGRDWRIFQERYWSTRWRPSITMWIRIHGSRFKKLLRSLFCLWRRGKGTC